MDGRKNNGGHKTAGRKSKAEEIALVEKLGPLEPLAFEALQQGLKNKGFKFVQLFYNYYAGKPRETKDINISEDVPLFMD